MYNNTHCCAEQVGLDMQCINRYEVAFTIIIGLVSRGQTLYPLLCNAFTDHSLVIWLCNSVGAPTIVSGTKHLWKGD